jgi:hypothetical protein
LLVWDLIACYYLNSCLGNKYAGYSHICIIFDLNFIVLSIFIFFGEAHVQFIDTPYPST